MIMALIRKNHINQKEKAPIFRLRLFKIWSGKRDSNSRPQPWQGCALPTELFPQCVMHYRHFALSVNIQLYRLPN